MTEKIDHFKEKSKTYSKESKRVQNVQTIAQGMLQKIDFSEQMHILDFGSGTGLLTIEIAPYVKKITGIDNSPSMNEVLLEHQYLVECELDIVEADFEQTDLEESFDGIISSMTLHHIEDIQNIFKKFYDHLKEDGFLAIADLYSEDGTFHSDNAGVFHFGFEADFVCQSARKAGFVEVCCEQVSVAKKPNGDFPIFLLTARK